jgi:hypothetical protein
MQLTFKAVKKMQIKVCMTYDTVTPESAAEGDHADHGFTEPGGWRYSIADDRFFEREKEIGRQEALAEQVPKPELFDTVEEAADFIADYGVEPSGYPGWYAGLWYTQVDCEHDRDYFEKGEETRHSFHVDGNPPEIQRAIYNELKKRKAIY